MQAHKCLTTGFAIAISHFLPFLLLHACPLCDATSSTISEDIVTSEIAVIGRSIEAKNSDDDLGASTTRFYIVEILKIAKPKQELERVLKEEQRTFSNMAVAKGQVFLLFAYEASNMEWGVPLLLSPLAEEYVVGLSKQKPEGTDRLLFYLGHISSSDELVSEDAYNEFAKTSMDSIRAIQGDLDREKLLALIKKPDIKPRLRGLCWMLLSLVGKEEDIAFCWESIRRTNPNELTLPSDFPAVIACVVSLGGEQAMTEIEELLLRSANTSTSTVNAVVSAIRVLEQELHVLSKKRLCASLQLVLEREDMADYVIPDLARWEDWSAMERLERLFYESDTDRSFVRIPIINYMRICPRPEAKESLKRMEVADPKSAERAARLFGYKVLESTK